MKTTLLLVLLFASLMFALTVSVNGEIPAGQVNGSNRDFTIKYLPKPNTLKLSLNDVALAADAFTRAGKVISLRDAPQPGDSLKASYTYDDSWQR